MEELKLSDRALEESKESIKKYCAKEISRIEDFLYDIRSLSSEWEGPNFDSIFDSVQTVTKLLSQNMDSIKTRYSKYLDDKIDHFRARPTFNGTSLSSSSSASSSSTAGGTKTPKTIYDKIFEKHNKDLVTQIYFYLRRINFYAPDDRISFYDPDGRFKRGLYKNIMGIDINSDKCESDLLFLTGQHIFFQMRHNVHANLLRSISTEMNSKRFADENAFQDLTKKIKTGQGINYRFLHFDNQDTQLAFNFFTHCFHAHFSNNVEEINKYKQYYSNSYHQFKEILSNLKGV